jgi:hypothetical protein
VRGAKKKSLSPSVRVSFSDIFCVRYASCSTGQRLSSLPVAYGNVGAQNDINLCNLAAEEMKIKTTLGLEKGKI